MRKWIFPLLALGLIIAGLPLTTAAVSTGVPPERYERLQRGVNLPGWLWLNNQPVQALENHYSETDFALMKDLGLTCVRVPIDMENMFDPEANNLLNGGALEIMDDGFETILAHDLAIIVDLHSISQRTGGSNYSGDLGKDEEVTNNFYRFWEQFAGHLRRYPPNDIILSPMNEPVFMDMEDKWPPIQEKVVSIIRQQAPEHTIVATNVRWSNLDWLIQLEPLEDDNIIYNFHFYEPHVFTHQGATWSSDIVKTMRHVPYPSSPEAVEPAMQLVESQAVKDRLERYGEERWNKETIEEEIKKAADWAEEHGCKLTCDEFGVYDRYVRPEHRVAWLRDVRQSFEQFGVHWVMWTWAGSFGVADREDGEVSVDRDVAQALGLNVE